MGLYCRTRGHSHAHLRTLATRRASGAQTYDTENPGKVSFFPLISSASVISSWIFSKLQTQSMTTSSYWCDMNHGVSGVNFKCAKLQIKASGCRVEPGHLKAAACMAAILARRHKAAFHFSSNSKCSRQRGAKRGKETTLFFDLGSRRPPVWIGMVS